MDQSGGHSPDAAEEGLLLHALRGRGLWIRHKGGERREGGMNTLARILLTPSEAATCLTFNTRLTGRERCPGEEVKKQGCHLPERPAVT